MLLMGFVVFTMCVSFAIVSWYYAWKAGIPKLNELLLLLGLLCFLFFLVILLSRRKPSARTGARTFRGRSTSLSSAFFPTILGSRSTRSRLEYLPSTNRIKRKKSFPI